MTDTTEYMRELDESESWALLEGHSFGRLAYSIGSRPEIVPINYYARDRRIFFRTSGGSKLFGVHVNPQVCFEIDDIRGEVATSVIVDGTARQLEREEDIEYVESLPLRPWIPADKYYFVEIDIDELTGREFTMAPEEGD